MAVDNNYFCIHIFDWDDPTKIINKFLPMTEISAANCEIKELTRIEAKEFLVKYHPQNYTNDIERLGLFYKEDLIEVMTFTKPRFNKHYEWEIARVCAKPGYHIINGCQILLDAFKNKYNPKSILVYCDLAKLTGNFYEKLGFIKLRQASPSRHWYNPKVNQHITDTFLWTKGFDRLFGTDYGKQASNSKLMLEHGFVEVYDCGQATYVWQKEE